jgi:hypothetical protein
MEYNRECWIILLGFSLDFWSIEHIQSAIALSVLDYSIRDPLTPFISPEFYGWIGRGGAV